jgi:sulfatase maturation enzyme AslB (radical SAM superfamily)
MVQMLRDFSQLIETHCTNCDFKFLCSRCFIHFAKDGEFVMNKEFCDKKKKKFDTLSKIVQLIEEGVLE